MGTGHLEHAYIQGIGDSDSLNSTAAASVLAAEMRDDWCEALGTAWYSTFPHEQ